MRLLKCDHCQSFSQVGEGIFPCFKIKQLAVIISVTYCSIIR